MDFGAGNFFYREVNEQCLVDMRSHKVIVSRSRAGDKAGRGQGRLVLEAENGISVSDSLTSTESTPGAKSVSKHTTGCRRVLRIPLSPNRHFAFRT